MLFRAKRRISDIHEDGFVNFHRILRFALNDKS